MALLKNGYVASVRIARRAAGGAGLLSTWEQQGRRSRFARWARSLFAIYDIDDMVRLDLPWWTLDAIEKVDAFLAQRKDARVFEYGSGASTIWLARRAKSVTSVEHDPSWHAVLSQKVAAFPNVTLILARPDAQPHPQEAYRSEKPGWQGRTFHDYVHAIDSLKGQFDVIVIDGRARPACLNHAKSRLAEGGLIVFDNTHRGPYRQAIARSGLLADRTGGLTACLPYPDETTLLTHASA